MKKKFTLVLSMLLMVGLVYDYNYRTAHTNSAGAQAGNTGSPGDGMNCATSCHSGPNQTNEMVSITSDIPGSGYVPGTTYTVTVTATGGGTKFGFQASPQDNSGNVIGTLIASGPGTQFAAGGTDYITHNSSGTTGSGGKTWTFEWTAPASGSGAVTFYGAVNFTDASGTQFGDVVVTATHTTNESSVGIGEAELASINVYPNPVLDQINIARTDVDEEIMISLFGVDGRVVYNESHDENLVKINVENMSLSSGVYFLQLESEGNTSVKKLLIK